ncbi:MAG: lipopolysaccharide biosynthesis protein [Sphingomonadales bacterium]|nr:lipopolysaccharide biosynthesis protein [Sphingomonadales bacterium]
MQRWRAFFSHRLVAGTLAGTYGQLVQLVVQLLSLPVFTAHWGLAGYGSWLILFTLPSTLAIADLGLTSAGGNSMTAAAARGEFARARSIYASMRLITLAVGLAIVAGVAVFLWVLRPHSLDFARAPTLGHAAATVWLLLGYGFLSLVMAAPLAAARAVDAFAGTIAIQQTVIAAEAACGMLTAGFGGGLEAVALAYVVARLVGVAVLNLYVVSRAHWLRRAPWRVDLAELRDLLAPAMAALVLPGANAVVIQGAVVVIGAVNGPAAVPAFTAVRTLSRTALQFAFRLNFASMPRYTVLAAQADRAGMARILLLNLVVTALLVAPAAVVLLLFGRPIVALWTHGLVHPTWTLLGLMLTAMLFDAAWVPLSNLVMALNRHAGFSYAFLASGMVAMALGWLLQHRFGIDGMAMALVAQEAAMTLCVWRLARRLDMLPPHLLRDAWALARRLRPAR